MHINSIITVFGSNKETDNAVSWLRRTHEKPIYMVQKPALTTTKTMLGGQYLIIDSSIIGMESVRKYSSVRMDAYQYSGASLNKAGGFRGSLSNLFDSPQRALKTEKADTFNNSEENAISQIRMRCIHYLFYLLFGEKIDEDKYSLSNINGSSDGFSVDYYETNFFEEHYFKEEESTAYSTAGKVITADGRELKFNLGFELSRSFEESYQLESSTIEARMCDPLVINLDTNVASVSDKKILFDLDADGEKDSISMLSSGSGYLSLDLNEDGIVNDGSELFGTHSGDGFKDLSRYDSDGNGWIDEADEIFEKLRICVFDKDGEQKLYKLKEKDIGAIYLGNVNTDFSLMNQKANHVNAAIRKTGIFLYENGSAGTIQHVDLAKELLA